MYTNSHYRRRNGKGNSYMHQVIIYTRVSSKKQIKSLKQQKTDCKKHAKEELQVNKGKIISDICAGDSLKRKGLERLMRGIRAGKVDHVIVIHTDRLSRDDEQLYDLLVSMRSYGVHISSVFQRFNTADGVEEPFFRLLGKSAKEDREALIRRTVDGRAKKAQNGSHAAGSPPYGYKTVNRELVINSKEAEAVRKIFAMHAEGNSFGTIAKTLNSQNVPTKLGGKWYRTTVREILKRRTYLGYYRQSCNGEGFEKYREDLKIL